MRKHSGRGQRVNVNVCRGETLKYRYSKSLGQRHAVIAIILNIKASILIRNVDKEHRLCINVGADAMSNSTSDEQTRMRSRTHLRCPLGQATPVASPALKGTAGQE